MNSRLRPLRTFLACLLFIISTILVHMGKRSAVDMNYLEQIEYKGHLSSWYGLCDPDKKNHNDKNATYIICDVRNLGNKRCYIELLYKHDLIRRTVLRTEGGLPPNMEESKTFVVKCKKAEDLEGVRQEIGLEVKTLKAK